MRFRSEVKTAWHIQVQVKVFNGTYRIDWEISPKKITTSKYLAWLLCYLQSYLCHTYQIVWYEVFSTNGTAWILRTGIFCADRQTNNNNDRWTCDHFTLCTCTQGLYVCHSASKKVYTVVHPLSKYKPPNRKNMSLGRYQHNLRLKEVETVVHDCTFYMLAS